MRTFGEFYRETTRGRKDLITKELPTHLGNIRIEQDLFGWKIYAGKYFIKCRSEEEARYLKVYFDIGVTEIKVPRDLEYLKSILPDLENIKRKTDEIIEDELSGIISERLKEQARSRAYMDLMYDEEDKEEDEEEEIEEEEVKEE
jgi:hypothetical protein